jgi:hypothetical protein
MSSTIAQLVEQGCSLWQKGIKVSSGCRLTGVSHCRKSDLDLANRSVGHISIVKTFPEQHESFALLARDHGPSQRSALASVFFERLLIGGNGLLEQACRSLALG